MNLQQASEALAAAALDAGNSLQLTSQKEMLAELKHIHSEVVNGKNSAATSTNAMHTALLAKLVDLDNTNKSTLAQMLIANAATLAQIQTANKLAKQTILANAYNSLSTRIESLQIHRNYRDPTYRECNDKLNLLPEVIEIIESFARGDGSYLRTTKEYNPGYHLPKNLSKEEIEAAKSKMNDTLTGLLGKAPRWEVQDGKHAVYYE